MLSVIHGWSPIGDDDEDVNISPEMRFLGIKPLSMPNSFLSPDCPPLDTIPKTCPPAGPIAGTSSSLIAPSSDRRAQRNRNRDPSWIPRPRNAFIIFRCEYSREHSQGSQDAASDDESSNLTVKTLSKRAADAWKQLPASERERYKVLADKEREEHARLYPHYRFRPMKRQVSGARRPPRECAKGARIPSVEPPRAPSRHLPSVLAPAPEKARSSPPDEHAEVSALVPRVAAMGPLAESSSCSVGSRAETRLPLNVDYNDALLSCPLPETTMASPVELYAPGGASGSSMHADALGYDDAAQEGFAIGLYNYDLFSPFSFAEYY